MTDAFPTAQVEFFFIYFDKISLFDLVKLFESFNNFFLIDLFKRYNEKKKRFHLFQLNLLNKPKVPINGIYKGCNIAQKK